MTFPPACSNVQMFIGDTVVGVHRVPARHEDDLEGTVRAAGLVRALDGLTRSHGPCAEPQKCAI